MIDKNIANKKKVIEKSPLLESKPSSKNLEDFLEEDDQNAVCHLTIKTVDPSSTQFKTSSLSTSFKLYQKYQIHVHQDKEEDCTMDQFKRFLVKSPLQVLNKSLTVSILGIFYY